MTATKDILREIYLSLDRETFLRDLNPKRRHSASGEYLELDCPECEKKARAFIYTAGVHITCNRRDSCGYSISLWDYLQQKEGLSNQETLQKLASVAGISLPALSEEAIAKIDQLKKEASVLEEAFAFFKKRLLSSQANSVVAYLKGRGYLVEEIARMDFGYNPGYKVTKDYLVTKGYNVNILKYLAWRDDYSLVFPYRDANGNMVNIWGRRLTESKDDPKYKPYCESGKATPFFFDKARGLNELILVEGYFDPMIALERGIKGMIGLGGASISQEQLETLLRYNPKKIILALDQDEAGFTGTEKMIKCLGRFDIDTFVVSFPKQIKDPDQYITTKGIEAFSKALSQAKSAPKWAAMRIIQKHAPKTDREKRAAIREAANFKTSFLQTLDRCEFLSTFASQLALSQELLDAYLKEAEEDHTKEQLTKSYQQLLATGNKLLEKNDLSSLEKLFNQGRPTIKRITAIEPYTIEKLQQDLQQAKEGLRTGYNNLDELVRIHEGSITLIAGRPSHGKTTLMLNLFLNMVQHYPKLNFCFFSYEETKPQIAVKLLNILAGHIFQEAHNLPNVQGYLKSNSASVAAIEEAKKRYDLLVSSGRMKIIGEPYYVDELAEMIRHLKEQEPQGAVFIDYIQKVKNRQKFGTRQLELQKTSEIILETAKACVVPIILGAQLGRSPDTRDKVKLDNLREAGDLEQDANLVLGLFNSAMEKAQETQATLTDRTVDITVTPLKNRNGIVNKAVTLEFDRPILKIREKLSSEMP